MSDVYVPVFFDWPEATRELNAEEKGRLIDAIVLYARQAEDYARAITGNERFVFPLFQMQIDRARAMREGKARASRQNGRRGGRPVRHSKADVEEDPEDEEAGGAEDNPNNPLGFLGYAGFSENPDAQYNNNNNQNHDNQYDNEYEERMAMVGMEEDDNDIDRRDRTRAKGVPELWLKHFGVLPTPTVARLVGYWAGVYGYNAREFLDEAIEEAAMYNARSPLAYIAALFRDWRQRGIDDLADLD